MFAGIAVGFDMAKIVLKWNIDTLRKDFKDSATPFKARTGASELPFPTSLVTDIAEAVIEFFCKQL